MRVEIIVPRLGWSMEEGNFVAWLKKDGEVVRPGDPLFSIEGDKAVQEVEAIDGGILRIALHGPKPGDSIRVGDVLGHLVSAEEAAAVRPETRPSEPTPGKAEPTGHSPVSSETTAHASARPQNPVDHPPASPPPLPTRGRTISPRAFRVASELGVDWSTIVGTGRTGRIRERDIRAAAAARGSTARVGSDSQPVVLLTGACGFIGTWVARELLQRQCAVVAFDVCGRPERWAHVIGRSSSNVPLIQGSLLDRELLASVFATHRVTHVIHLAALLTPACQANPWEGCRVNVLGSLALFEQLRKTGIQGFSYASSVAVFGDVTEQGDGPNGSANNPLTFYGAFKKSVELIAAQYWREFKIASVGIRPQVAYGPERELGMSAGPSLAARAAAAGQVFRISYTGRVGYDYVEDVARAFVHSALETPPGAHLLDLAGEIADVQQVIAAIDRVVPGAASKLSAGGPLIPAHRPPRPRLISTLYPDWKTTSLEEGIRRTVEFYQARMKS